MPSIFGGVITGGSVSPDGRRVALCDYFQGYELVLPAASKNFNDIWKQKMTGFDLGKRKQGESIAYRLDGKALLATSEGKAIADSDLRESQQVKDFSAKAHKADAESRDTNLCAVQILPLPISNKQAVPEESGPDRSRIAVVSF